MSQHPLIIFLESLYAIKRTIIVLMMWSISLKAKFTVV